MMRVLGGLLVVLLLAAPAAAPSPALADAPDGRDGPLPRLDRVGPIVDDDEAAGGGAATGDGREADRLRVSPAVTEAVVPPDRRREVRHVVTNTTERRLHLDLDVVEARLTTEGPGPGRTGDVPPDAAVRLVAPVDGLVLDPGEGAVVISTAQADPGEAAVFALRVRTSEAEARAHVVVAADDLAGEPELELDLGADGSATVTVRADRPAVVDVRLTGRSWTGADTDQTAADLIVGPEGRELETERPTTLWPGPVRAGAYVTAPGGDASAEAGRLVLPLSALAAALLLLTMALLARWRRRRVRHGTGGAAIGSRAGAAQEEP
jgi:hypothetical protein